MFGWFFIPNTSADIVSISNIPFSLYAQIIFLCFSFFLYRNKKNVGVLRPLQLSRIGSEKIFCFLLIVTFFTTYMLFPFHFSFPDYSFNPSLATLVTDQNKMSSYISHMLSEFVGILYLFFLMRFVNTKKDIEVVKMIIFLLKDNGLTINGAIKLMNSKTKDLDATKVSSIKGNYHKNFIKTKSRLILKKIKKLNG